MALLDDVKPGRYRDRPDEESGRSKEEQERYRGSRTKNRKPEKNSRSDRRINQSYQGEH